MCILDIVQISKWYLFIEHFLNISLEYSLRTVKKLENVPNTGFRVTYLQELVSKYTVFNNFREKR